MLYAGFVSLYGKYSRKNMICQEETKKYLIDPETGEALEKQDPGHSINGKTEPWNEPTGTLQGRQQMEYIGRKKLTGWQAVAVI